MKKLVWLMIILGPIGAWAQSGSNPVSAAAAAATEASGASTYLNASEKNDSPLAQVRNRLGLTPEQQPLWQAYESKVDAYTALYYRQKPVLASPDDAAVHQIGRMVDNLQNRLAALEDVEQAAKNLYASLSPEQQKTANQVLLSTIPGFGSSVIGSSPLKEDSRHKEGKAAGSSRSRRMGGS